MKQFFKLNNQKSPEQIYFASNKNTNIKPEKPIKMKSLTKSLHNVQP